jgi:peroxiredoxin
MLMRSKVPSPLWPVLLLTLATGCGGEGSAERDLPVGPEPGSRSPELAGTLADGDSYRFDPGRGRRTVLVFYRGAQCGLCRHQLEQIEAHRSAYDRQGTTIIGVTLDPTETSAQLLEQMPLGYSLVSVDSATFERWEALDPEQGVPLPATYIVDGNGVVRFRHIGRNAADRTVDADMLTLLARLDAEP